MHRAKETRHSDIKSIINEFSLYKRLNIKGKVTDLSVTTENDVEGMIMTVKTTIIHYFHHSGFEPLTIFGYIYDVVKDKKCYDICNLSLNKHKSDRTLKTTEKMR